MRSPATGELGGRGPQARALPSNGEGGPPLPLRRAEPAGAFPSLIASLLAFVAGERFAFIRNSVVVVVVVRLLEVDAHQVGDPVALVERYQPAFVDGDAPLAVDHHDGGVLGPDPEGGAQRRVVVDPLPAARQLEIVYAADEHTARVLQLR